MRKSFALAAAICCLLPASSGAAEFTELWRTGGFMMPESVSYDAASDALYVGNINSPDMSANGAGYISKVGLDGKVIEEKFADGLNAPKGTYIANGKLYVAGVEEIAVIDMATGEVIERLSAPGATFLNDLVVAEDGTIYATETLQGAIYTFSGGSSAQFVVDPALAGANGIVLEDGKLLVATLGDV
ncbi:MAG: gluconolaconase, partial [Alphaproteobacteria bacterium]